MGLMIGEHVWRDVYHEDQAKYFQKDHRSPNSLTKAFFGTRQYPISEISGNLYDRVLLSAATGFADVRGKKNERPQSDHGVVENAGSGFA